MTVFCAGFRTLDFRSSLWGSTCARRVEIRERSTLGGIRRVQPRGLLPSIKRWEELGREPGKEDGWLC